MKRPNYVSCIGDDWQRARMRALVRDDFRCQAHHLGLCDEPCEETRLRNLQVHHIKQRINGGTHDLDNLITICREHHMDIHPHMRWELNGKRLTLDLDGDYDGLIELDL